LPVIFTAVENSPQIRDHAGLLAMLDLVGP